MAGKSFSSVLFATLCLYANPSLAQNAHTKVTFDKTFRTVAPPNDAFPQNANHATVVSAVLLFVSLIFVVISLNESRRWKSTVPAALTIGAATCVLAEAINNYLANCYWTQSHNPNLLMFTVLGREYDLYVGIIWWSFGAFCACFLYGALMRKVSTGTLWAGIAFAGFCDLVLEECLLNYGGLYLYYGHQPLVLVKSFPCWWLFCNVTGLFLGIAVTYRYRDWFNGWRSIFLLPILPFCYIGAWVIPGMPTVYAVHADFSPLVTQMFGILSCCIAVVQTGVMIEVFLMRNPLDLQGTEQTLSTLAVPRISKKKV